MEGSPKNYAFLEEKDSSHWYYVFALLVILGLGAGGYRLLSPHMDELFRRQTVGGVGLARSNFSAFFHARGVDPIDPAVLDREISEDLLALEKNPCDWPLTDRVGGLFLRKNERRGAANIYLGFAQSCPSDGTAERNAANLFYDIQEYEKARALFTSLTERFPYYELDWYHRAQAEHHLGMTDQALQSFTNTLLLTEDPKTIGEWVFTEFSTVYAEANRFCEAMTPISTYVSFDPGDRDTTRAHTMLANLARQGNCTSYAEGRDSFLVTNPASIIVKGKVNGVVGTFIVDTGASFVALNQDFAHRAKISGGFAETMATANGETRGTVSTANLVQLGKLQASDVPVVVISKPVKGVDGLLGQSFLARFEMTLTASRLSLATKRSE